MTAMAQPHTIQMPQLYRADVAVRADSFDAENYTVDLCWTTGARGRQFSWEDGLYDEELVVSPKAVRLDRLNAGAPFLNVHSRYDLSCMIGAVVAGSAKIVKGEGLATVRLSRRQDCAGVVQDIRDKIITSISCGYRYIKVEKSDQDSGIPLWRVLEWEPFELSAVPVPLDMGATTRSDKQGTQPLLYPCIVEGAVRTVRTPAAAARARMRMSELERGLR
jgi:hypothetical protein